MTRDELRAAVLQHLALHGPTLAVELSQALGVDHKVFVKHVRCLFGMHAAPRRIRRAAWGSVQLLRSGTMKWVWVPVLALGAEPCALPPTSVKDLNDTIVPVRRPRAVAVAGREVERARDAIPNRDVFAWAQSQAPQIFTEIKP